MVELLHFLHLASGVAWAGGALAFAFIVEPTLLALGGPAMKRHLTAQARFAGPFMALSGSLLLLTGIARAITGGGVASAGDLVSPYGLWVAAAFAIVLLVTLAGGAHRKAVARALDAEGDRQLALRGLQRRNAMVTGGGILVTIAIMAILGLGLY